MLFHYSKKSVENNEMIHYLHTVLSDNAAVWLFERNIAYKLSDPSYLGGHESIQRNPDFDSQMKSFFENANDAILFKLAWMLI